jgi:hypothetical protein
MGNNLKDKIEENLNKIFNIETNNNDDDTLEIDLVPKEKALEKYRNFDTIENELKDRKAELGVLLDGTQEMMDQAKEGVNTWGKPSNLMAYSKLLDSTVNVINSIKTIDEKIHNVKEEPNEKGDKIQNNFIFAGDSRGILDAVEKAMNSK